MSTAAVTSEAPARRRRRTAARSGGVGGIGLGIVTLWLSLIVLLPLAAVTAKSLDGGLSAFWDSVSSRQAVAALRFTIVVSVAVAAINAVAGLAIAWTLVRDSFPGRRIVNAVIDLPFAMPTIVAGITLLALWGPTSPVGVNLAFTQLAVALALLFVTLPFGVRAVQPVLIELDEDMEQAAASLGARPLTIFRRIILPNLVPAILSGAALSFARAVGEFGSIVLISGNKPFDTQVSSVFIFKQIESDNTRGAAAVAVVLLAVSLSMLIALRFIEYWGDRHDH
ncbi:MAG TPA: sulfate ABC transporter permease subunit CysT [Baekduia sp.]|uniref:sulfate ABC transporter permease subunit CysT n=1 Tax=Baekduia sp. TaxID=2600305 RepID=UPI002B73EA56|nr:sulfate ABC transporter permease subunit CysT [Baekduia sp.]HMJ34609.1 sulfate ABC transporter permease subunit CysT [Baekduia sp.]